MRSLLRHADCDDINELQSWVGDRTELDPFVTINEHDGSLVVGFDRTGVQIDFPTTVPEFWETITRLEDDVIAEWDVAAQAELETEAKEDAQTGRDALGPKPD